MSPATTIGNNQDSQFVQVLEELKSAPTAPGTFYLAQSAVPIDMTPKDAKAAADKLARQVSKVGLQSLECVLFSSFRSSDSGSYMPIVETRVFSKHFTLSQTTRSLDMNENPPPSEYTHWLQSSGRPLARPFSQPFPCSMSSIWIKAMWYGPPLRQLPRPS